MKTALHLGRFFCLCILSLGVVKLQKRMALHGRPRVKAVALPTSC
jgi:hypothetical protein